MKEEFYTHERIQLLKQNVKESMKLAFDKIHKIQDPVTLFQQMKFCKLGFAPDRSSENIIEQINQSFTILMSCYAAEKYFPKTSYFSFAFAQSSGRDMIVYDHTQKKIIAEVEIFTAVVADNNQKLRRDVNRLRDAKIADGCRRMVCYSAQHEHKLKSVPGDMEVEVKFSPLDDFVKWIRE